MPKLSRLRFVSVGHPNARFNDLVFDFRDVSGAASDSTIWLRNGGGKSSLLNLFFALIRPNKRDFLGGKAEAKQRAIDDYIKTHDRAVVAAEWELDQPGRLFDSTDNTFVYLTGVFYEWRHGGSKDLRRLFFAARSHNEPRLTIDQMPIYIEDPGQLRRRTLADFRQEWNDLRNKYPHLDVTYTENQKEWGAVLENARIDPELFSYQIRMNQREGGVDELFRFNEHEQFIDFLLELIIDPALGEKVSRNIATYRSELKERKDRLIPEKELLQGLVTRLAPLMDLSRQRSVLNEQAQKESLSLIRLDDFINHRIKAHETGAQEMLDLADFKRQEADLAELDAAAARKQSAVLRLFAASERFKKADEESKRLEKEHADALHIKKIWNAAGPLHRALKYENDARGYRQQLELKQKEHAPLLRQLQHAANQYAGAVRHKSGQCRDKAGEEQKKENSYRKDAKELREMASECNAKNATAQNELGHIESFLKNAAAERQRLEKANTLQKDETAAQAVDRLKERIQSNTGRLEEVVSVLESLEQKHDAVVREKETVGTQIGGLTVQLEHEDKQYKIADQARTRLEKDPRLRLHLELESVALEKLSDHEISMLRNISHQVLEKIVAIKIEKAGDERAVPYIENNGLLPPAPEVETVLKFLTSHIPAAWTGWTYLEANVKQPGSQDLMIDRSPHLVTGIVVRDSDYDKAVELLREKSPVPDYPVVIAPQGSFKDTGPDRWTVIGPRTRGFFDKSAAKKELVKRRTRLDKADDQIRRHQQHREELEDLLKRLLHFRSQYPLGWFAQAQERIRKLESDIELAEKKKDELERIIGDIQEDKKTNTRLKEQLMNDTANAEKDMAGAERFLNQYENLLDSKKAHREELDKKIAARLAEIAQYNREADDADGKARECALMASKYNQEAVAFEKDIDEIRFVSGAPEPMPGAIEPLKNNYIDLKETYESRIEGEHLHQLIQKAEDEAKPERKQFDKLKSDIITEPLVQSYLDKLDDISQIEENRSEAERAAQSLFGYLGNKGRERSVEESKMASCKQECEQLGADTNLGKYKLPPGPLQADEAALKQDEKACELEEKVNRCNIESIEAKQKHLEYKNHKEKIQKDLSLLDSVKDMYADLIPGETGAEDFIWTPPQEDKDIEIAINNLKAAFNKLKADHLHLDDLRKKHTSKIYEWTKQTKFESIQSRIAGRFSGTEPDAMEDRAEEWEQQLILRVNTIDDQLKEMEKHRDLLIRETLNAADDGLRAIKSAARQSRLPDHVPGLGGSHFLRIDTREPRDQDERKGRIGELIDQLIDEGNLPGGLALVQRAVRKLTRPVKVRVLNPDPDIDRQSVEITEMAKFSGGEQLTGAILLYCTLAQLRVRSRGQLQRPSSVLLLDNPIGRASRVKFLELQREVARAMNVQLIYTTAVNDMEALHALPNIIRVRNSHIDRNTGDRMVELEKQGKQIDLVRVSRVEQGGQAPHDKPQIKKTGNEIPN